MNIDKLKKVIQKANPEIMELKFGCRISFKNENGIYDEGTMLSSAFCCQNYFVQKVVDIRNLEIKIFGRPIRLADVLLALSTIGDGYFYGITDGGVFFHEDGGLLNGIWNLADNNLDNQSDECKEFLIKLLVKDNE